MPCYNPLKGWYSRKRNPSGKRSVVFKQSEGFADLRVEVPCGKCLGCKLARARMWAVRISHEASLYNDNCFITLTYNDDCIPANGSLVKADFQKFMKRLRKRFPDIKIRYFMCGEYGEKLSRPHYHACLFNFDFPDKVLLRPDAKSPLATSEILSELWPFGMHTIGDVTFKSASYVASYVTKKVSGAGAKQHYDNKLPEYVSMSLKDGIGLGWLNKFASDIYPSDEVVVLGGMKLKPPKYYDEKIELTNPRLIAKIKETRKEEALNNPNLRGYRLSAKGRLKWLLQKEKGRSYEAECL